MLQIDSLFVSYGSRPVLHDVSLEVPSGTVTGLIGPNGAGKSTLIRAVSGVIPLQSGHIYAQDLDLARLSARQRAARIAVVPQARNLPAAFTAWEMVLLGRTPHLNWLGQISAEDRRRAHQAMERTDTLSLADRHIGELSGGEQQRVMIARALAQSAPILLMDEPTAHLDLQYQVSLLSLIRDLARQDGLTILIALHDLNLVGRYTTQAALLVKGLIQASGPTAQVLDARLLSQAYRVPLQSIPNGNSEIPIILPGD